MACLCDFCSAPDAGWRHPARSFIGYVAPGIVGESVGDWAACAQCHELIVSNDRAGLVERSLSALLAKQPELTEIRSELAGELARLHVNFFEHRAGHPMPIVQVKEIPCRLSKAQLPN